MTQKQEKPDIVDIVYAGITKNRFHDNEPWTLKAAFKECYSDGSENVVFCGPSEALTAEAIKEEGSIPAFLGLSSNEALRGIEAIKRAEQNVSEGKIAFDDIIPWDDMVHPNGIADLYEP